MEYLAALALQGGRATSNAVGRALGRSVTDLSSLRDALIQEGDSYSPQRGYIAMTMPTFSEFIIARYEQARNLAETPMLSIEQMRQNLSAW